MKSKKQLGIWMDHSVAHLLDLNNSLEKNTIVSQSNFEVKTEDLKLDESLMQNREQNQLTDYFKQLSEVIKDYDEVLLFGPTNAKAELVNTLKDDRHFDKVKIEVKSADKMTENQRHAFVKEHFDASGKASKNVSNSSFFFF
ncbi:MAG: hypothetical protein Q8N05_20145 [Bacteroidota bacterium]|nr:hypothetical protein [Bacteroidota bacterium]